MSEQTDTWVNIEDTDIPPDLPTPMLWRVLVMPVQPRKKTASGILLPFQIQDAESHLQYVVKVAALGPLAFRSFKLARGVVDWLRILAGLPVADAPQVGDWVVVGRYAGQRAEFRGVKLTMLNDDEILCHAKGPEGFKVYA